VDADLTTISQYENNGYAILLTKDKFYFLYSYGKVKFSTDIELDNGGKYYTLVPYRNGSDYCFMVGFINSSSNLNIKYYKINISLEQIELIKRSLTVGTGKDKQTPDIDTWDWYNPMDWIFGAEDIFKASIYIPISNNQLSAVTGANQHIDYDEAMTLE
jgi:hypothetical protein